MDFNTVGLKNFIDEIDSSKPIPGGGSVSAIVGSCGIALGNMVGHLTLGKDKYADFQEEVEEITKSLTKKKEELMELADLEVRYFSELSKLYRLPKDAENREILMEKGLSDACIAPMKMIEVMGESLCSIRTLAMRGNKLAISDAGAAAILIKGAVLSTSLNVFINTKMMKNKDEAEKLNKTCSDRIMDISMLADEVFAMVYSNLQRESNQTAPHAGD